VTARPTWQNGDVAVVMMSAIGDAVHTLPVVTALKRHAPGARVTWILQPGPASLVRGHPAVDEVVVFDKALGWRGYQAVRRQLAGRRFALLLDLQVYFKAGLMTALVPADVKLGFDFTRARDLNWLFTTRRIPPHPVQHVQDQYFEFLAELGVPHEPVTWDLGPWPAERAAQARFTATLDRPAAVLAPGSSDPGREWLPERWVEVCAALDREHGLRPVLVGGRAPRELELEQVLAERLPGVVRSTLGAPLREMVGILDAAAVVLAVNSAPLHMAVALDRPVISLLGHWNPKRTGPYRRFGELWLDAYGDPGEDYPVSQERRPDRMHRIAVADVLDKVRLWRERYGPGWRRPAGDWG
jgi:heptosyltransferase I